MWLDWISNSGPLALESDMLTTVLHGLASNSITYANNSKIRTPRIITRIVLEME